MDNISPPFVVQTRRRKVYDDIENERRAAVLAKRLIYRGAFHVEIADRTGRIVGIYERAA